MHTNKIYALFLHRNKECRTEKKPIATHFKVLRFLFLTKRYARESRSYILLNVAKSNTIGIIMFNCNKNLTFFLSTTKSVSAIIC